nr:hypothetical protein [Tanacetum cinerariifolium]
MTSYRGGLNEHIRATTDGYLEFHGGFGYGVRNKEGHIILKFATANNLVVVNTSFKKRDANFDYIDFLIADASEIEELNDLSANICMMDRIQQANSDFEDGPSYDSAFISEASDKGLKNGTSLILSGQEKHPSEPTVIISDNKAIAFLI